MNSKQAQEAYRRLCRHLDYDNDDYMFNGCYEEDNEVIENALKDYETIKKDLEILECFKKIDKKELKDFIENQIKYTLNENTWLSACNADLAKEKPTKHLLKIKEWLEDDERIY